MNQHGIRKALTGLPTGGNAKTALERYPDRFVPSTNVDPNTGMEAVRSLDEAVRVHGAKAAHCWGTGLIPQVPINDKKMYPVYSKCIELDIPIFVYAGVPGPRIRYSPQYVGLLDEVCWFFPELRIVTRHGGQPWTELMVKLLLKWPNLYYSTSAFAPKHYDEHIIDFVNTRGADKIIYAGYYPMGLDIDRIFAEMPNVPFREHVWPKFLYENAARVLKLRN
jgi:predicted TIM-barrel fold metal-dependent hydrolase